ncbi:MAG: zinc-binding dehydrogenase, partial [Clostridia bacterium]|nr:zinc-binding dehydrogenase [Clostridia bacterium]
NLKNSSRYFSLWGGFSEYTQVVDYNAMVEDGLYCDDGLCTMQAIPESIDPRKAVMIITLKEVYSALERLDVRPGARVAVAGCGPVGLAMVNALKLMKAKYIAVIGHHDDRLAIARKTGANLSVNTRKSDAREVLKNSGIGEFDLYIDAVGKNSLVSEAMSLIRPDGVIGIYGIGLDGQTPVAWDKAPYNFTVRSVQWPVAKREMAVHEKVVNHVLSGGFELDNYVTHILPLEDFNEGFELVRTRQALKVSLYF